MKKALLIAIALGLLVGAWAVPATAIDWSASGLIYVTGAVHQTVPSLAPYPVGYGETWSWVRQGAVLNITAKTSDDLYGVLSFNMISDRWGEADVQGWGFAVAGANDVNSMGAWYKKETGGALTVLVKDAFIDFRVPPNLPMRMRVGVQPIILRPKVLMFYDGPGISMPIVIPPINLTIKPAWYKKWEGVDWQADDSDVFSLDVNVPIGPVKVGGFFWWENHNTWGTLAGFPAVPNNTDADFYWIGGYSDGKIGPIGYEFDFVYQMGSVDTDPDLATDFDVDAWILRTQISANLVPRLTFGAGFVYSTGEDFWSNDGERYTQPNTTENYYGGAVAPLALGANGCPPLQDFFMLQGNFMGIVPCFGPAASFLMGPTAMGGVWYVRGFAQYMVTDWLRVATNFGWIGDTAQHGDTLGNVGTDSDDIGFEIDVGFNASLYPNLQLGFGFGYLFAGNALEVVGDPAQDDAWMFQLGLGYFF